MDAVFYEATVMILQLCDTWCLYNLRSLAITFTYEVHETVFHPQGMNDHFSIILMDAR